MREIKKVIISSADFGTSNPRRLHLPPQNSEYDIKVCSYDDSNYYGRQQALHPRMKGKIPKMLDWMHEEADFYIWIDSKFKIVSEMFVSEMVSKLEDFDICLFRHPDRSNIKDEAEFVVNCMDQGSKYLIERYREEPISEQAAHYLSDPLFKDENLFAMGLFAYSKRIVSDRQNNIMKDWFFHNTYWTVQDQISFPYLLEKSDLRWTTYDFGIFENNIVHHYG